MTCFYCGQEMEQGDTSIYPLESPYVNLPMHKLCRKLVNLEWLKENIARIMEYTNRTEKNKKK